MQNTIIIVITRNYRGALVWYEKETPDKKYKPRTDEIETAIREIKGNYKDKSDSELLFCFE